MIFLWAFLVGGAICAFAQWLTLFTQRTPGEIVVWFTVAGTVLGGIGLYQPFVDFAGAGALIPVSGFGNAIVQGMLSEAKRLGWEGLFTGAFEITGLGLSAAVLFGFLAAVFVRPKG